MSGDENAQGSMEDHWDKVSDVFSEVGARHLEGCTHVTTEMTMLPILLLCTCTE